jgi:3-carboxy-cis,cis-muconate cycloisomerase
VALANSIEIAQGLEVNSNKMTANIGATLGLPMAEAVSAALAQKIGRDASHKLLRKATAEAANENVHLGTVLKRLSDVTMYLNEAEIDRLLTPAEYLGSSERFIARVLRNSDARH